MTQIFHLRCTSQKIFMGRCSKPVCIVFVGSDPGEFTSAPLLSNTPASFIVMIHIIICRIEITTVCSIDNITVFQIKNIRTAAGDTNAFAVTVTQIFRLRGRCTGKFIEECTKAKWICFFLLFIRGNGCEQSVKISTMSSRKEPDS